MDLLAICICIGVLGYLVFWGPRTQISMGKHLARMTNVVEEIERSRPTALIGMRGGIGSLPLDRQRKAEEIFERGIAYLKAYPRQDVTRELTKNAVLAQRMGKPLRAIAIGRLTEMLSGMGVALGMDEFMRLYA